MKRKGPKITVVICTRNRERFITACVESLLNQNAERSVYEILVVNNGSTDGTRLALQSFVERGDIRVIDEPLIGLSRARNTGWRHARGEFVGYIDDDAVAEPTWVLSVLEVFLSVSPLPGCVGGPIELTWETKRPDWVDVELAVPLGYLYWGDVPRKILKSERLGGGNSAYPRVLLEKLGGFDERLGRGTLGLLSGEETQLQRRIELTDKILYYHPGIRIHHFVSIERTKTAWFYKRYFWGGVTDYMMPRTLNRESAVVNNCSSDPVLVKHGRQILRLFRSIAWSLGLGMSLRRTIRARVYLSYVGGRLYGVAYWRRNGRADG